MQIVNGDRVVVAQGELVRRGQNVITYDLKRSDSSQGNRPASCMVEVRDGINWKVVGKVEFCD